MAAHPQGGGSHRRRRSSRRRHSRRGTGKPRWSPPACPSWSIAAPQLRPPRAEASHAPGGSLQSAGLQLKQAAKRFCMHATIVFVRVRLQSSCSDCFPSGMLRESKERSCLKLQPARHQETLTIQRIFRWGSLGWRTHRCRGRTRNGCGWLHCSGVPWVLCSSPTSQTPFPRRPTRDADVMVTLLTAVALPLGEGTSLANRCSTRVRGSAP